MHHPDNEIMAKATNPKPSMQRRWYCLAVHKNTCEHTIEYVGAEKQIAKKVGFRHLSNTTSIAYNYKAVIELLHAQNDIAFVVAALFSPFVLARVAVLASCGLDLWSSNTTSFWATQKVNTCAYCACAVHMQTQFTTLCLWSLRSRCLPNPCQSDSWCLTTAMRNLSRPTVTVEAWLPFMTQPRSIPSLNSTFFYWDGTEAV